MDIAHEEAGRRQRPPHGQRNQSWGIPPRSNTKGCFRAERWDAALKRDTETSSERSLSCLLARLKCISGDAPAKLLTAIHFVNSCGSTRHYHPPPQRGISALLSGIATLGFITLDSSVRLVYKRFRLTKPALPEMCQGALPHLILPLATQDQEPSLPSNQKAHFQKGFLKQPQQRLHTWKNNISKQFPTDYTNKPSTELNFF